LLSVLIPCTTSMAVGVEEPMPILELGLTVRIEVPEEEAILKISLEPAVPWRLKVTVEEEALTPKTVPLSMSLPAPIAVVEVQAGPKPILPVPVTGLVMVVWRLFGKLKVKVEPEVVICQAEEEEEVAKVKPGPVAVAPAMMVGVAAPAMVICPAVEVVMVMLVPLIKVVGAYLSPVESAPRSCPCRVGAVVVPVPPLAGAITVPFQTPVAIVPTLVKEEETTVAFKVVPERVPAGATTAAVEAVVNLP
jgi:hypothetical protein